jgi:hypothetical protein
LLTRLRWTLNRLRCMTAAEVGYRSAQALRIRVRARWQGRPRPAPRALSTATGRRWFSGHVRAADLPSLCKAADDIAAGRFSVLALGDVMLGRPPDWLRCPKTGVRAPLDFGMRLDIGNTRRVGDIKYLWEPSRHLWLVPLAQAFEATADMRYADAAVGLLDSWLQQSPHPLGPHWSSSLEAGIRLINWSVAWHMLGGDAPGGLLQRAHPRFLARWVDSIYWHLHFVSCNLSAHSSANNHLVGELAGLYVGLCTWPRWPRLDALRPEIRRRIAHEALLQNAPDGVNREQATSYQQFVLDFLLLAGLCARAGGEPFAADYWQRLEAMCGFIAAIMDSAGNVPQIGDADDGVACGIHMAGADNFASLLVTGALLFERGDYALAARSADAKSVWLLGAESVASFARLLHGAHPLRLPMRFEQGGYAILGRDPGGPREVRIVFDAGPLGYLGIAAHGHADALSMLLSVGGQPMLVDPGTFSYLANPVWRQHFRSTAAHNTIEVDGRSQSDSGGPFMWTRHADARWLRYDDAVAVQTVSGEHQGYAARGLPLVHRRTVSFDSRCAEIVVSDELTGSGLHDLCLRWQVADRARVELDGHQATVSTPRATVRMLLPAGSSPSLVRASEDAPVAWVSHRFERRSPSTLIECRAVSASLPLAWVTRIQCDITA